MSKTKRRNQTELINRLKQDGYEIRMHFWGKRALFTRPEFKAERMTYEVMTPSAARSMLEAIYWHPGLEYVVDRIYVLNPVKMFSIKKNEIDTKGSIRSFERMMKGGPAPEIITRQHIQQRSSTILVDVDYVVEFHPTLLEGQWENDQGLSREEQMGKFVNILLRRAEKGQCFAQPYFGARDYSANFELWDDETPIRPWNETRNLGVMLHSMDYDDPANIHPRFFMAELEHGVMQISGKKVYE